MTSILRLHRCIGKADTSSHQSVVVVMVHCVSLSAQEIESIASNMSENTIVSAFSVEWCGAGGRQTAAASSDQRHQDGV